MPEVARAPQLNTLPYRGWRLFILCVFIFLFGTWARFHFTNAKVSSAPSTEPDLIAAKQSAQPVLDALEKYRADNGLYPTILDQLAPAYVPSVREIRDYRYSAGHEDYVLRSDACTARYNQLHGWVLKEAKEYQKEVAQFKVECIEGYRNYRLQSPDFERDPQSQYIERWAYYDSKVGQWTVGWCAHEPSARAGYHGQDLSSDGVCRWRDKGKSEPW
jgi:hypothetical protein